MVFPKTSLRYILGPDLIKPFRKILYSSRVTWGAKCLGFALMDSLPKADTSNAVLARRLGTHPSQVTVWRQELVKNDFDPRPKKENLKNSVA